MKVCKCIIITFTLAIIITGCSAKNTDDKNIYEKIYDRYSNLSSYECLTNITINSNKTSNIYTAKQKYVSPDKYDIEYLSPDNIKGLKLLYNDNEIIIKNPQITKEYNITNYKPNDKSYLFIDTFFKIYFNSEDVLLETINEENKYLSLTTDIPGRDKYRNKLKLIIDTQNLKPKKLITYDVEDKEVIIVEYTDFNTLMEEEDDQRLEDMGRN